MKQRTITAIFFAAVMLGGIYWNRYSFQVLFTAIAGVMLWEFFGLVISSEKSGHAFRRFAGSFICLMPLLFLKINFLRGGTAIGSFWSIGAGLDTKPALIALFASLALGVYAILRGISLYNNIRHYLLGLVYISLPILLLFSLATPDGNYTPNRVFGLLWLIWTNDTLAYLIGSRFGKRKLWERISPKKTWEGTIGGAAGTVLMAWGLSYGFSDYSPAQWLALGIIVALLATPGDLLESMLKRSAGVKDSGKIMPGHGGLLDRFDSLIFVLPFAWLAVVLLGG